MMERRGPLPACPPLSQGTQPGSGGAGGTHCPSSAMWRSAFVAALFAWHPLHVESVAWVSERKDVLSAFFWLLTLWAYACYTNRRSEKDELITNSRHLLSSSLQPPSSFFYVLALLLFACALMSKPMAVTLPFVLLLLDYWPLDRVPSPWLLLEKVPFLVFAVL